MKWGALHQSRVEDSEPPVEALRASAAMGVEIILLADTGAADGPTDLVGRSKLVDP